MHVLVTDALGAMTVFLAAVRGSHQISHLTPMVASWPRSITSSGLIGTAASSAAVSYSYVVGAGYVPITVAGISLGASIAVWLVPMALHLRVRLRSAADKKVDAGGCDE